MIARNFQFECDNARPYYYDCLDGQCKEEIPHAVQTHISQCRECREEIQCLAEVMRSDISPESEEASHVSRLNSVLEAHFDYAQVPVTCAIVKGFLPGMASQSFKITIPTPISVHIEQCPTCRKNLLGLQSLHLSDVQLQRLTHCLEEGDDAIALSTGHLSEEQVSLFSRGDQASFHGTCPEHVCKCAFCRERILSARQTNVCQPAAVTPACNEVSFKDLFDMALPSGSGPLPAESSRFNDAILQHVCHCETCLRHLESLDQMLVNLLAPNDSGVVTHYRLNSDQARANIDDGYDGYPIQVDIQKGKVASKPVRSNLGWMKMAAVVAVLLGVTIFSMLPKAGASFLNAVYESTTRVPVVHIRISRADGSILKEHWIWPPNRAVTIQGQTKTVYNAKAGFIRTMDDTSGPLPERQLAGDSRELLQRNLRGLFELWPLEMSENSTLTSEEHGSLDVYDLKRFQGNRTVLWRAHVDRATQRVQKVLRSSDDRGMVRTFDVSYPSKEAGEAFLREAQIAF